MRPRSILPPELLAPLFERLDIAASPPDPLVPAAPGRRQPVHTVYGGAHLFRRDTAARLGEHALAALAAYAPDAATFAAAVGLPPGIASAVYERTIAKLRREPVEDYRIDFEDGYGPRPDSEEDRDAERAAAEVVAGMAAGTLPPFLGIRVKPLCGEHKRRAVRTLERFVATLCEAGGGRVPDGFVITLPKVVDAEQVAVAAEMLSLLEAALHLPPRCLAIEIMIETPQAIVGRFAEAGPRGLVEAAGGRCVAAHFGVYDYTAALDVAAGHQTLDHPACDFARHMMQVALAGSGVWLSDGATNVLPVAPRQPAEGGPLAADGAPNAIGSRSAVHRAWRLHYEHVRRSLGLAYYQGWDLHPAQLPSRYAAVYSFFLEGLDAAARRLRNFIDAAARATLAGEVFDDAATGQGLLNTFLRAIHCGAVGEEEVQERTGLSGEEIGTRSFATILGRRSERPGR